MENESPSASSAVTPPGTMVSLHGAAPAAPSPTEDASAREAAALVLQKRYAGFVGAEDLSPGEQLVAVASLVPMALQVVDEARDTIARLREENEELRRRLGA